MPRYEASGTVRTKQAVHIRTMPCMEEGKVAETAKNSELLTVLQESDGRYEIQRENGTKGWIYYTRLKDINVTKEKTKNKCENKQEYNKEKEEMMKKKKQQTAQMITAKIKELAQKQQNDELIAMIKEQLALIATKHPKHKEVILMIIEMLNE